MWQTAKNMYHLCIAILANIAYGFPGRGLLVVGITGTDGKTTTSSLIYHMLKTAGKDVSLISTVAAYIGNRTYDTGFHVTNPSSTALQKFLKKIISLKKKNVQQYLVLEVTSHGIDQNRVWGIPFAIAGITNITHEHLDYHKTYENYVVTKAKLLQHANIAILNKDDTSFSKLSSLLRNHPTITYAKHNADITLKTIPFATTLLGDYNSYNFLLAISVAQTLGINTKSIQKAITSFVLPVGRTEIVYEKDFTVMVDFAHTPNAIEQLLSSLSKKQKGRLIHVFGSAGLRDKTKRPLMGKASASFADVIILTAEDPRSESVSDINAQIKKGITHRKDVYEIADRQQAITKAIAIAKKGDMVIITGKGHEQSMNYGKGEEEWSDQEAVKMAIKRRYG